MMASVSARQVKPVSSMHNQPVPTGVTLGLFILKRAVALERLGFQIEIYPHRALRLFPRFLQERALISVSAARPTIGGRWPKRQSVSRWWHPHPVRFGWKDVGNVAPVADPAGEFVLEQEKADEGALDRLELREVVGSSEWSLLCVRNTNEKPGGTLRGNSVKRRATRAAHSLDRNRMRV
jgi:hypothetical protein